MAGIIIVSVLFIISLILVFFLYRYISEFAAKLKQAEKELARYQGEIDNGRHASEATLREKEAALAAIKKSQEAAIELEKLKKDLSLSQQQLEQGRGQAEQALGERQKLMSSLNAEKEAAFSELEKLKGSLNALNEAVKAKDLQIAQLKEQLLQKPQPEQESSLAELEGLKKDLGLRQQELEQSRAQAEQARDENLKLQDSLDTEKEAAAERDIQIAQLKERLLQKPLPEKDPALALMQKENQELKAASEKLAAELSSKNETLKLKEEEAVKLNRQIERLNSEYKDFQEELAELKKMEIDISGLEKILDDQKDFSRRLKQRIEEGGIKMQLLEEKTKQGVESISRFAEGKEFEEFRKSVHMDELIRKHEEEIRNLKIKNMELQKKLEERKT